MKKLLYLLLISLTSMQIAALEEFTPHKEVEDAFFNADLSRTWKLNAVWQKIKAHMEHERESEEQHYRHLRMHRPYTEPVSRGAIHEKSHGQYDEKNKLRCSQPIEEKQEKVSSIPKEKPAPEKISRRRRARYAARA